MGSIYPAGTDGRVRAGKVKPDGTPDGAAVVVAEVTGWSVKEETARQPTTNYTSPTYPNSGAVAKTHKRGGGIVSTTFSVEGIVQLSAADSLGYSPAAFRAGREYLWDFILSKDTTVGHYGVLGTITAGGVSGVDVTGQPKFSVTVEANGLVPDLAVEPPGVPPPPAPPPPGP